MSWILVRDGGGREMCLNLKKDKKVRWKKEIALNVAEIKEHELPGYYRLEGDDVLERINDEILTEEKKNLNWEVELDTSKTNADIQQSSKAQKLTTVELNEMKQSGADTNDIIAGLIQNNENFEKRTDFSKDKYIKRKKLKHDLVWRVEKCTLLGVFKHFQRLSPRDMIFLREEMFCLFNHYLDLEPDSRVFMMDRAKGAALASAAQIIQPDMGQIYLCDFKAERFDINTYKALQYMQIKNSRDNISVISPEMALDLPKYKDQLQFTHLAVCAQVNLVELIDLVHANLLPGAKVVVYSRFIASLEALANRMFEKKEYVDIQIRDAFLRKLQVLGLRTHPMMSGNLFGGFLLTAYRVNSDASNQR